MDATVRKIGVTLKAEYEHGGNSLSLTNRKKKPNKQIQAGSILQIEPIVL